MGVLNRLTDRSIRAFVTKAGPLAKKSDGGALYLMKTPAGSAVWRINYKYDGRSRTFAVGVFPEVTLAKAREERTRVKQLLAQGIDPVAERREAKEANTAASRSRGEAVTFQQFAMEWLDRRALKRSWSEIHKRQVRQALERYLFGRFGRVAIADVTQQMVADAAVAVIERRRYETAAKLVQNVSLIFRSARLRGHRTDNPAEGLAEELIPTGQMPNRRPALLKFDELGDLLRRTDMAPIAPQVRLSLKLIAYTAVRIGNALTARWEEFDLDSDTPVWTVAREKMKAKRRPFDHRVILGPTIAADLRTWRKMTGGKGYVFPAPAGGAHLKHETLEKVYRRTLDMHGKHSVHGWRSSFATLTKDSGLFSKDAVNLALDHVHDSEVARAYDRGERFEERIRLAFWWDAQLTAAQHGTEPLSVVKSA